MNSKQLSKSSVMWALVKREFREQRALFVYLPIIVSLLVAGLFIATLVRSAQHNVFWEDFKVFPNGVFIGNWGVSPFNTSVSSIAGLEVKAPTMLEFSVLPQRMRANVLANLYSPAQPFLMFLFCGGMLYYFLMTLFKQRQDRSILFWNSMPVSDTQVIVSKLLAGMIGCLAVFFVCLIALQLFMLMATLVYGSFYDINAWETFVTPLPGFWHSILLLLASWILTLLWCLPVYAWLLLASAWSRSMPFAWAVGPWVILAGIELLFTNKNEITVTLLGHMLPAPFMISLGNAFVMGMKNFPGMELALSVVLGVALVYAAIRLNRSEDI